MIGEHSFRVIAAFVFLAFAAAGAASAGLQRPDRSVVARGIPNASSDGKRAVAWGEGGAPGTLVVRDEAARRNRRIGLGRDCKYVGVYGGVANAFLVNCSGNSTTWMVVDGASGRITQIADPQTATCEAFTRIGHYWIEGVEPCNKGAVFYLSRRTGHKHPSSALAGEPRLPQNLDAPHRPTIDDSPRTLFVTRGARVLSRVDGRSRYAIELAGSAPARRFRCSGTCVPASLDGGLALWLDSDGTILRGYVLRTRKRLSWNMPEFARVAGATARRVYYTTPSATDPQRLRNLKSFRWR